MASVIDFSDAAAVRELAAAGERLVRLEFPEGLGSLYCHSFLLSFISPVLRNVLEDTQQQQQGEVRTIPLAGDSNVSVWKLALGLIYRLKTATITLDSAQGLLLLADKWNMECITDMVGKFLMSKDIPAADSRLKDSFTPATVSTWLTVFSKCGLEQHVQLCIDYIVSQETNVDIDMAYLQPTHANMLFAAIQRKLSKTYRDLRHANGRIDKGNSQRDKLVQLYLTAAPPTPYYGFHVLKCSACGSCWISMSHDSVTCCNKKSATQGCVYLDEI